MTVDVNDIGHISVERNGAASRRVGYIGQCACVCVDIVSNRIVVSCRVTTFG